MDEISVKLNEFPTIHVSLGNVNISQHPKPTSHSLLENRDLADQHPISAITGLGDALDSKIEQKELDSAVDSALGAAKERGDFDGKTAYEYAQDAGYTGSEAEFAEKLAAECSSVHIGPSAPEKDADLWIDTDEEPEEEIVITTPDFAADEGEDGHILNRTHFVDKNGIVHKLDNKYIDADWMATSEEFAATVEIIPEQKVSSTWSNLQYLLQPGIEYDVIINGVVYPCVAWGSGAVQLGNNTSLSKNDYPFCVYWAGGTATMGMFFYDKDVFTSPIYLKVTEHSYTEYNKLPEEFLPDCVVKSVNGKKPDENGNVEVEGGVSVTAAVGQTIIVEEVDESGKPTKWKAADYQPRTHWSETVEVLPETTCEVVEDIGAALLPAMAIAAGDDLTVVYNGTEYACTCADMGDGMLAFGNYGVMVDPENPVDTGEPFAAVKTDSGDGTLIWACVPLDGSASFTMSVIGEVHHAVPGKYLPVFGTANVYNISISNAGTSQIVCSGYALKDVFDLAMASNSIVRLLHAMDSADGCVLNLRRVTENSVHFGAIVFDTISSLKETVVILSKNADGVVTSTIKYNYFSWSED